jgi:hypothetical protein
LNLLGRMPGESWLLWDTLFFLRLFREYLFMNKGSVC